MKFIFILLLICVTQAFASDILSQKPKLKLAYEETPLQQVLDDIEKQTNLRFLYHNETVNNKIVKLDIKNKSWYEILEQIKEASDVNYRILEDNLIVLTPSKKAQPRNITGTVTDQNGDPLTGVTIIVKGTTIATITDLDGKYEIRVPDDAQTLVFSFVGMLTQEVSIGNQTEINVNLQPDIIGLEEVVVIGYGTIRKSDLTGAVSSVKSEELLQVSTSSVSQAIQGRASGVRVINYQGPGEESTILIRGIATINNAGPLYVIDGFPTDGMNHLAPTDIESIDILKDASATAVYGSRGANGVVLITTKTGTRDKKPVISVNIYAGREKEIGRYDMLDATQYATLYKEALENSGTTMSGQLGNMMDYILANNYKGTDWQDEFIRPGFNQNYNISLSGGSEISAYNIGATYAHETGIVKRGFSEKIFLHANTDYKILDKIKVGTKINYYSNASNYKGPFDAISKEPMVPAWDSYTNNYGAEAVWNNPNQARILDYQADYYLNSPDRQFRAKAYLQMDDLLIKGLSFHSQFGGNLTYMHHKHYNPVYYVSGDEYSSESSLDEMRSMNKSWAWSNYFIYNMEANNHRLNVTLGTEAQKREFENMGTTVFKVPENINLYYINASSEKEKINVYGAANHNSILSYFARSNYNYDNRFLLTATIRADGSSKFIDDYRWGYFPSFSLGWNVMEESFADGLSGIFNSLKIRGGWGQVGNQSSAGNYDYAGLVYSGYKTVFGVTQTIYDGAVQLNVPNNKIHWEIAEQINIGLNFITLNTQLRGSLDWFIRDTKDMIISKPIPYYAGQRRPVVNAASMRNSGVETEIGYNGGNSSGLRYSVSFNLTYVKNEVFNVPEPIMPAKSTRTEDGEPMAYFYGYQTDGIINDQAELDAYLTAVPNNNNAELGDVKFIDQITVDTDGDEIPDDRDGEINADDRVKIGNPWPVLVGGISIGLEYKNFDFSLFGNGEFDKDVWNEMAQKFEKTKMTGGNLLASRMGRWTPENPNADQPRMHNGDPNQNSRANDRYIEDASFFRLTTAQIGYTLPEKTLERIGLNYLRLYLSCDNVFTITNYSGLNPEIGFAGGISTQPGFDEGTYPLLRTITIGVNIKF